MAIYELKFRKSVHKDLHGLPKADLRRILMYEEFEGHPLRKDYPTQRTQPLIPYREGVNNEKLPPFDEWEGMPFGRQEHDRHPTGARREVDGEDGRNILGFESE